MTGARDKLEEELLRLRRQRTRYLQAAHAAANRHVALRRLLAVERLAEEIEALEVALASLDDRTTPITIGDDQTIEMQWRRDFSSNAASA